MKSDPKDTGRCPCGKPSIGLKDGVPVCERCKKWENNFERSCLHGATQTAQYAEARIKYFRECKLSRPPTISYFYFPQ